MGRVVLRVEHLHRVNHSILPISSLFSVPWFPAAVYNNSYLATEPTYGVLSFFMTINNVRQSL
jgi:hypothetical protein